MRTLVDLRGHYPVWSVRSVTLLLTLTCLIATAIVFLSGKRPILVELEIALAVVAAAIFAFLAIWLYRGARLKEAEAPTPERSVDLSDSIDTGDLPDLVTSFNPLDADAEGCAGAIVGFLLSLVVLIVLILLLAVFWELAVMVFLLFLAGVYWVLHLALRQVFAHSEDCRHRLVRSLAFAGLYTFLYTGWMFVLLLLVRVFVADGKA